MAAILRICTDLRNAQADALATLIDAGVGAGTIKIYTIGSGMPAHPATAITDQTLLGTLTFSNPCVAAPAAAGVLTFDSITQDAGADDDGTAAWARIADSDGNAIFDVNVGESDESIILNTVNIVAGGPISITSFTYTVPES
jgi:hypothetical protein